MMDFLSDSRVALVKDLPVYSKVPPYHPSESLPEWPECPLSEDDNPVYRCVRQLFYYLELDSKNYGTSAWNPLGNMIQPGNVVVLKPNFVFHRNLGEKDYGLTDTDSLVTHGSVIRAVLDYVAKALQGSGKIIIGDCPIQGANWNEIIGLASLDKIQAYLNEAFPSIELVFKDYRLGRAVIKDEIVVERIIDEEALIHYEEIDLKEQSLLIPLMQGKYEFGVTQYPKHRMRKAHNPASNKYLFPKEILYADVVINLPKMKSHMKAGVTCALKNLIGLNGHKDYLPHFRFGSPKNGGDEYPDGNGLWDLMWLFYHWEWELDKGNLKRLLIFLSTLCTLLLKIFSGFPKDASLVGGGSWHGNDTLWRTILDINRAFFYFDRKSQQVTNELSPDVRYITILDGLIAGHKESPLSPTPIGVGVMMAAFNPLAMDAVATAMMGFDIKKIKQINEGFGLQSLPLANFLREMTKIYSNLDIRCIEDIYIQKKYVSLEPSKGFKGCIEYS
jgi:uncharacterized protein (DUF362 family)